MNELTIRRPDDFHGHLRQGEMLRTIVPLTSHFGRVIVMPNTTPPVLTGEDAQRYREEITQAKPAFEPLMTIKLTAKTTPEIIAQAAAAGVIAGKLYPEGVTTNSADGVSDIRGLAPVFEAMQAAGMVLCLHGETPGVFILDREADFVDNTLPWIVDSFPGLRIVLEHLSSAAAVEFVRDAPDHVGATVTAHHLVLSLDGVIGNMLEPHHFCKPVAKRPEDRRALIEAAISGDNKFFLGTDSAPHDRAKKECASGCAGVFTAPVAMGLVTEVFEDHQALDRLEAFVSLNGSRFYGLAPNEELFRLTRQDWIVPADYQGVVPIKAGQTLRWTVAAV